MYNILIELSSHNEWLTQTLEITHDCEESRVLFPIRTSDTGFTIYCINFVKTRSNEFREVLQAGMSSGENGFIDLTKLGVASPITASDAKVSEILSRLGVWATDVPWFLR